jgi:hypothetical protein
MAIASHHSLTAVVTREHTIHLPPAGGRGWHVEVTQQSQFNRLHIHNIRGPGATHLDRLKPKLCTTKFKHPL